LAVHPLAGHALGGGPRAGLSARALQRLVVRVTFVLFGNVDPAQACDVERLGAPMDLAGFDEAVQIRLVILAIRSSGDRQLLCLDWWGLKLHRFTWQPAANA
jgi:hypothetical protein